MRLFLSTLIQEVYIQNRNDESWNFKQCLKKEKGNGKSTNQAKQKQDRWLGPKVASKLRLGDETRAKPLS